MDEFWSEDQMDEIEYPNLKTLFINHLTSGQLKSISKLKLPNLNFAHITYYNDDENQFNMDQQIFLKLFKNVDQLYIAAFSLALTGNFNSFTNLTKLAYRCKNTSIDHLLTAFDMMIKHKSLQEITINEIIFYNYEIVVMESIFNGIIKLGQSKSSAKILISIHIISHKNEESEIFVNNYIKEFVLNNWHVSFQNESYKNVLYLKK